MSHIFLSPHALAAPQGVAQASPTTLTWVLAIIAILLLIVFLWLLFSQQQRARRQMDERRRVDVKPMEVSGPEVVAEPPAPAPIEAISPAEVLGTAPAGASAAAAGAASAVKGAAFTTPAVEDNLEIIEGIGPKIAGILKAAGVTSFAQLAAMEPARISEILLAGGIRLADPHSWPEQARLAAAGDMAGLKSLQDRLKGGRE